LLAEALKKGKYVGSSAKYASDFAGDVLLIPELGNAYLDRDPLRAIGAISEAAVERVIPEVAVVESLVEAKLRLDLRQQGLGDEEIERAVIATKDLGTQRALQVLTDSSGLQLAGSTDPLEIINSAVKQAINSITGTSLISIDPIDEGARHRNGVRLRSAFFYLFLRHVMP
jgi:hypothetical protein